MWIKKDLKQNTLILANLKIKNKIEQNNNYKKNKYSRVY